MCNFFTDKIKGDYRDAKEGLANGMNNPPIILLGYAIRGIQISGFIGIIMAL